MNTINKIGFGGGCHWCTEAVFQSLIGVCKVEQGFISSTGENQSFSEAVIVSYDPKTIKLEDLIAIHLHTHKSTSAHRMRTKYRSAIYTFSEPDREKTLNILTRLQQDFKTPLATKVLLFVAFKASQDLFHNYYYNNTEKPFCTTYISPKLKVLMSLFSKHVNRDKVDF